MNGFLGVRGQRLSRNSGIEESGYFEHVINEELLSGCDVTKQRQIPRSDIKIVRKFVVSIRKEGCIPIRNWQAFAKANNQLKGNDFQHSRKNSVLLRFWQTAREPVRRSHGRKRENEISP